MTLHVKDQNWFAVLLDFAIVVVGVFIGIQVANWNDERAERGLRAEYLTQLQADLRADIDEAKYSERIAWDRVAAIIDIFDTAGLEIPLSELFVSGEVIKAPTLPKFSYDYPYAHNHVITYVKVFGGTRDTFEAIVSNGHFQLMESQQVVRALQQYYRLVEDVQDFDSAIVEIFRRLTEMRSRHGISLGGRTELKDLVAAVKTDQQLAAELDSFFMNSGVQATRMVEIQLAATALIDVIDLALQQ